MCIVVQPTECSELYWRWHVVIGTNVGRISNLLILCVCVCVCVCVCGVPIMSTAYDVTHFNRSYVLNINANWVFRYVVHRFWSGRSLLSNCHTFSRCTCKRDCIYAHKQSTAVPAVTISNLAHSTPLCAGRLYRNSVRTQNNCEKFRLNFICIPTQSVLWHWRFPWKASWWTTFCE